MTHGPRIVLLIAFAFLLAALAKADQKDAKADDDFFTRQKLTGDWGGLRKDLESWGITFTANEQAEIWENLKGGRKRGGVIDGVTTPSLTLDLEKLMGWKGATFFVNGYQIHGLGPTPVLVGNQQPVSNIEALPSTKLYQLWIEQKLCKEQVSIRIGQAGANDEFMLSQAAQLFLAGSFGYPDLLVQDLPSSGPNYPLATPMIRAKVKVTDEITYLSAIFNGDPAGPGPGNPQARDFSGTAFRLNDPPLIFNEIWYQVGTDKKSGLLPGTYKLGSFVHTGKFTPAAEDIDAIPSVSALNNLMAASYRRDYAVYVVADQMIWRKPKTKDEGVTLFGLFIGGPVDRNREDFFALAGLNWKGVIEGRSDDMLGFAFAYAHTSGALQQFGEDSIALTGTGKLYPSNETVLELTYLFQVAPWWTIQPDVQYIFNPGAALPPTHPGINTAFKDAVAVGLRTKIDF